MNREGKPARTNADIAATMRLVADVMEWQHGTIEDFQAYAHRYGGMAGDDVYRFVLDDALRLRGISLEELRKVWPR